MREKLYQQKERIIVGTFIASLLFVIGGFLWAYVVLRNISQPLIIHFSRVGDYTNINQSGTVWHLASIAGAAIVAIGVNVAIALELRRKDFFLVSMLAAGTLVFGALIFIGFAAIISVN